MKPLTVCIQLCAVVVVLSLSYYVGRPIYYDSLVKSQDAASQSTDARMGRKGGGVPSGDVISEIQKQEPSTETEKPGEDAGALKDRAGLQSKPGENGETHFGSYPVLRQPIWTVPPVGSEMPPLEAFALTKEMIEFRAKKKVIAVTFANYAFMDFVTNWVRHLTDYEVTNILVGAMDTKILEALFWKGVPVFDMRSGMETVDVGWGTPKFHKMGREKVILINAFLAEGYEILMCDTDVVFLQDPFPYFERFPDADILTSSDEVVHSVEDDKLENWEKSWGAYNIGIFFWRPTAVAKELAKEWLQLLLSDDLIWDQNGFNDLAKNKTGPSVGEDGLFWSYRQNLKMGILPVSLFCSGHTYFIQELYKKLDLVPYAVHTTFQFGGTEGKRHRLREAKLFYDPPEYFDTPGGYILFKTSIPNSLLYGGQHTVQSHFDLVNYQLIQIRTALAVASALNRTLIMPCVWARFDRIWYGHPGILFGTKTSQPLLVPLDHVFEVNRMVNVLPEAEYGPQIGIREYSFLDNPLLDNKVKRSVLKVKLCTRNSTDCSPTNKASSGVFKLPQNSTDEELTANLGVFNKYKILEFTTASDVFGGFTDTERGKKLKHRIKSYTGIWCCVMDKIPGHIWYDIYWDEKPNWKPLPPATPADDHQPD